VLKKEILFLVALLVLVSVKSAAKITDSTAQHQLSSLCDSIIKAVKWNDKVLLLSLVPDKKALRAVYDSTDTEMFNYQVAAREKEIEWYTQRDLKKLNKWAGKNKVELNKIIVDKLAFPIYQNQNGVRFSNVLVSVSYRNRKFQIHFSVIELNEKWYYGDGLRMSELEVEQEQTPDYEAIDARLAQQRANRAKLVEKLISDSLKKKAQLIKAENDSILNVKKQTAKQIADSLTLNKSKLKSQEDSIKQLQKEKVAKTKDSLKQVNLTEKERIRAAKADSLERKNELKAMEKSEKEALLKQKESEQKVKAKQKKAEQKTKAKQKKKEAKEKKALQKEKEREKKAELKKRQAEQEKQRQQKQSESEK
jgi:hypothetical protein